MTTTRKRSIRLSAASKRVMATLVTQPGVDLFYGMEEVYGFAALERAGLVERVPGTYKALITEAGEAWLALHEGDL